VATYDIHQHLWPEPFATALRGRDAPPFLTHDDHLVTREGRYPVELADHDPVVRGRALDRDGIDIAVLSLQTSLGLDDLLPGEREELEETWMESVLETISASEGRLMAFAPEVVRDGFAGLTVGASTLLDLERAAPIFDVAEKQGRLVFVHPDAGSPPAPARPGWWEWTVGYPAQMSAAYLTWLSSGRERWPTLRIVFAMLAGGAPFQLERLTHRGVDVRSALDPNTFFDVATYGRRAIELLIETFGVRQLVYGSDTPVVDPRPTLAAVRGFGDSVAYVLQTETPSALLT
jgi:predicted TIM-barrel fold metal-dependent hydrolase